MSRAGRRRVTRGTESRRGSRTSRRSSPPDERCTAAARTGIVRFTRHPPSAIDDESSRSPMRARTGDAVPGPRIEMRLPSSAGIPEGSSSVCDRRPEYAGGSTITRSGDNRAALGTESPFGVRFPAGALPAADSGLRKDGTTRRSTAATKAAARGIPTARRDAERISGIHSVAATRSSSRLPAVSPGESSSSVTRA